MKRRIHILPLLLGFLLVAACIEDYNPTLSDSDENLLVVSGTIRSDEVCTFILSHTTGLNGEEYVTTLFVNSAVVSVLGDDGQRFNAQPISKGMYRVNVGTLSPEHNYWLRIETAGLVFTSTPQRPLYADPIDTLTFTQHADDRRVEIQVTCAPPSDGKSKYYRWDFEEYWEIFTPYRADFELYIVNSWGGITWSIDSARPPKNHGWAKNLTRESVMGSTDEYRDGRIYRKALYTLDNTDDRLSQHYFTRISQRSISREEYEYEQLRKKLSSEMGGLFTPLPSELPTNIHCENGNRRVIGFVGVSGPPSRTTLSIRNSEIYFHNTHSPRDLEASEVEGWTYPQLYQAGYRIHYYEKRIGGKSVTWTYRWCVDCTDPMWGASLERPAIWPNDSTSLN